MITLNECGKQCPIPVIETKKQIKKMNEGQQLEVFVDNLIAVQNLEKMAKQLKCKTRAEKKAEAKYQVIITLGENANEEVEKDDTNDYTCEIVAPKGKKNVVVAIDSETMGRGDEALGHILMKGFIYALTEQEELPNTVILYNGGAFLSTRNVDTIKDLKLLEEQGVEIRTCGTCLNHFKIAEELKVGSASNMYEITEYFTNADKIIKP